jgi:hypothetical protein
MATLKSADILAGIGEEAPTKGGGEPTPHRRSTKKTAAVQRHAATTEGRGKPSPYLADLRERLRDKTQLNFGGVPRFVRQEFERMASENRMGLREYFYHLLRQQGADIPPYEDMDGRKL